jgi:hypothetical protein
MVTDEPGWMIIQTGEEPDVPFQDWKQSVETLHATSLRYANEKSTVSEQQVDYPVRDAMSSIVDEIRSYNVADHTPMQCMQLIIDLQNKIKLVKKMPE